MKKFIIGLLVGSTLFSNFYSVFAEETTVEDTTVQEDEKKPLSIFDENFPKDYKKWTDIVEINKILYSLSDYFGWEINEDNIEIVGNGHQIRIYPQELYEDGRGNSLNIGADGTQIFMIFRREFKDYDEKLKYFVEFSSIITKDMLEKDLSLFFTVHELEAKLYIDKGFPQSLIDKIGTDKVEGNSKIENKNNLYAFYNDKNGIFNDNVLFILNEFDNKEISFESDSSIELPINKKKKANAKIKIIDDMYIENPKVAEEITIEETTVAELVTTTAPPVEKKFDPNSYDTHKYEEVMRDRDGLMLQTWTFYAEVFQYFEREDGTAIALVKKDGDFDQIIMLEFLELPDKRLVEGDTIDVYGRSFGLTDYNTSGNSTNTVPLVVPDKVLIQGIDY